MDRIRIFRIRAQIIVLIDYMYELLKRHWIRVVTSLYRIQTRKSKSGTVRICMSNPDLFDLNPSVIGYGTCRAVYRIRIYGSEFKIRGAGLV